MDEIALALRANPQRPEAAEIRALHECYRREDVHSTRRFLGGDVFVVR